MTVQEPGHLLVGDPNLLPSHELHLLVPGEGLAGHTEVKQKTDNCSLKFLTRSTLFNPDNSTRVNTRGGPVLAENLQNVWFDLRGKKL